MVLAQYLPMAVLYDPATLDLSDASVADRLRKQAKTRAVKVPPTCMHRHTPRTPQNLWRGAARCARTLKPEPGTP